MLVVLSQKKMKYFFGGSRGVFKGFPQLAGSHIDRLCFLSFLRDFQSVLEANGKMFLKVVEGRGREVRGF